MTKQQLEHILRASSAITGASEIVVIGSQAIWGSVTDPPPELIVSREVDVFTFRSPDDADLIDGSIGELSPFATTHGCYAHGVGVETATLPEGWKDRLVPLRTPNTGGATGLCLEIHDLAVSKLVAGREHDVEYVAVLLRRGLADAGVVAQRLSMTEIDLRVRAVCEARLRALRAP